MAPPLSLTIVRQGATNLIDLAEVGTLIPRSETHVDEAFLQEMVTEITSIAAPGSGRGEGPAIVQELQRLGALLFSHLLPEVARQRLRTAESCDLYLRLDEALIQVPWELCYDGKQFLATKFRLGRQVITSAPLPHTAAIDRGQGPLRVLLIADPTETLPQASQEAEQLCELLGSMEGVEVTLLGGREVRKTPLLLALQTHDLVHFAGHSQYNVETPSHSGWYLYEGILTAEELSKLSRPPLLVFSNSCQGGATAAWQREARYEGQAFDIGSAFLLAGVQNYISTFWAIQDEESTLFATAFYQSLTAGHSIGEALFQARESIIQQRGWAGLTWASYMLYGDPALTLLPATRNRFLPVVSSPLPVPGPQRPIPNMVGRETELAQLHQWSEKALNGERQVVFVTGEPGIGKTTVVEAFLNQIAQEASGWRLKADPASPPQTSSLKPQVSSIWLGQGQCIEHYGAGEAYLPVLSALGQLCREPGGQRLLEILGQHAPTWLVQMPALLTAADFEVLHYKTLGATRERMLREMAEALEALTVERPLVLWLEDLHWSDYSTLDLIAFLARRRQPARLLVIGTSRPVDGQGHPLRTVKQELQLHGQCQELALGFLTEQDVAEYLTVRFALPELPADLARVISQRTEGNPLFMLTVVESLVAQKAIVQREGHWELQQAVAEVEVRVPQSLRQMIEQQLLQLSPEEQRVVEAGSVAGAEFSAATVAAGLEAEVEGVEERCADLVRRNHLLQARGTEEWPDGTVASRYGFIHALYHEVVYERVTVGRRVRLHQQIGIRAEAGYGKRAREIATELAVHFERARDFQRAEEYRKQAGDYAIQRHAYWEATGHFVKGLEFLQKLPDSPDRTQRELLLQMTLGVSLAATKGFGSPEMAVVYARARQLCQHDEDHALLSQVLVGQWTAHLVRGELRAALNLAQQNLELAQSGQDPVFLLQSYTVLAANHYFLGEFARAKIYLDRALVPYDHSAPIPVLSFFQGHVTDVTGHTFLGLVLWELGYPDQGRARLSEGVALAQEFAIPFALALARAFAGLFYQFSRESRAAQAQAEKAIELGTDQGFELWVTFGTLIRGWALAEQGQGENGVVQIQQGLSALRAEGAQLVVASNLAALAESYAGLSAVEQGLRAIDAALEFAKDSEVQWHKAELYRIKGDLVLRRQTRGSDALRRIVEEAEACFRKAIEVARNQSAKSLELRATMSLARLWQQHSKIVEARQMLEEIYNWFTEGFETADLKEAKTLMNTLEGQEVEALRKG